MDNGVVPIIEGYEQFFTVAELSRANKPYWYEVTLWQLRKYLKRIKLTDFHNNETVINIGQNIGLTEEQSLSFTLFQWVKYIISIMPTSTQEEKDIKDTAEEAIEYANYIEYNDSAINTLLTFLMLTTEDRDFIFQSAKTM